VLCDTVRQPFVLGRVDHVDATAQDGKGTAPGVERGVMRDGIDAAGQTADDSEPGADQLGNDAGRQLFAIDRWATGAHHPDALIVLACQLTVDVEQGRGVEYLFEAGRIVGVEDAQHTYPEPLQLLHLTVERERLPFLQQAGERPGVDPESEQNPFRRIPRPLGLAKWATSL